MAMPLMLRPPCRRPRFGAASTRQTCWALPAASWVGSLLLGPVGYAGQALPPAPSCPTSQVPCLPRCHPTAGQSSYAHHIDTTIGQHVVDEVSFYLHQFLTTRVPAHSGAGAGSARGAAPGGSGGLVPSMQQLVDFVSSQRLSSEVQVRTDLYPRALAGVPVTHFFGAAGAAGRQARAAEPAQVGGNGLQSAAGALMGAAQQPSDAFSSAAPVVSSRRTQPLPLFAALEAAGGRGGGGSASSQAAALVAAAWAAVAFVAHRMLTA